MIWIFIGIGVMLLYVCWQVLVMTWTRLQDLGVDNSLSSGNYFDLVSLAGVVSVLISRVVWMGLNRAAYAEIPWGILPYNRSASGVVWLEVFPWRLLRVSEGITVPVVFGGMVILLLAWLFWPTIQLIRKLKLEKRGIMRAFLIRVALLFLSVVAYFGLLSYWVMFYAS